MQELRLKLRGLYTHPSELSEVPEGALLKADNIVIDKESIAEPRRGFNKAEADFPTLADRADSVLFYDGKTIAHHGTSNLSYYDGSTWTAYSGSYSNPDSSTTIRGVQSNENLYFTSSAGIKKLSSGTSTPIDAGAPKGLDVTLTLRNTTGNVVAVDHRVAYRLVWGYRDANDNLILGAPSQRVSIKNTNAGTDDIRIKSTIPSGVTTSWFYQIYRSEGVDNTSADIEPSDELQLVYEANPSSGDISNGYIEVDDITPDALRGATIYTASSQQGAANENQRPPFAKDVALYQGYTFYGNIKSRHRFSLTLLGVGSPNGIQNNDTIIIDGVTFTGSTSAENAATGTFKVETGSTASANIRETALSLIRVLNTYSSSTVYGYYLSGPDDLPGQMLIEARSLSQAQFTVTSSRATCWSPTDIPSSGSTKTSSNDEFKNGLMYSKNLQPEAVPLPNIFRVGSAKSEILRIVPLRDSLFIFKQDGIYRLTGDTEANFRVDLLDNSARLLAPNSAAVLNNQIYCLTDQGVVAVSDTGVQVVSRPIESDLLSLSAVDLTAFKNNSFGVGYESERKYILWTISTAGDTSATQAYVYNTFTQTWVRWTLSAKCGGVNPDDDKLYYGDASNPTLRIENKAKTVQDFGDFNFSTTISDITGNTLTITQADLVEVGDVIKQGSIYATITAVNSVSNTITVQNDPGFSTTSADLYSGINCSIQWAPITLGNPGIFKQFREVTTLFRKIPANSSTLSFFTEVSLGKESETISGVGNVGWGLFGWGQAAWGGARSRREDRKQVPRNKQRAAMLFVEYAHSFAFSDFQLSGLSIIAEEMSERVGR